MSNPSHKSPGHAPRDFEDKDIPLKPILGFGLFIFLFTAMTFVAVRWLFFYYENKTAAQDKPASPFAVERLLPPEPRLQVNEQRTLQEQRALEAEMLSRYAWVDQANGVVRIPVERAMDLVAERGFPVREKPPPHP